MTPSAARFIIPRGIPPPIAECQRPRLNDLRSFSPTAPNTRVSMRCLGRRRGVCWNRRDHFRRAGWSHRWLQRESPASPTIFASWQHLAVVNALFANDTYAFIDANYGAVQGKNLTVSGSKYTALDCGTPPQSALTFCRNPVFSRGGTNPGGHRLYVPLGANNGFYQCAGVWL